MSKTNINKRMWAIYVCLLLTLANAGWTQTVTTRPITEGMASKMAGFHPQPLDMRSRKPADIHKIPEGIVTPLYSVLTLGPKESPTRFGAVMEGADLSGTPRIWIDANANGDLTDDAPITWYKSTYPHFDGTLLNRYDAFVTLQVRYSDGTRPLRLNILRFDPRDPNRTDYRHTLLYIADHALEADIPLGAVTYHAMLYDAWTTGDFRGGPNPQGSGIALFIDVNHNGAYEDRGEKYDALRPFNIKGVTYELTRMSADGSRFDIVKSKAVAKEELPPPDLRVGQSALSFTHARLDGKTARFPQDYKGRLVLLYFWAAYCPVCNAQLPFVRDAYRRFHDEGVDILGVSLDPATPPDTLPTLPKYLADNHIEWPQIYDGTGWTSDLVGLYYVQLTPTPYLVDGDTGKILAAGQDLWGAQLAPTLQKALAAKQSKQ